MHLIQKILTLCTVVIAARGAAVRRSLEPSGYIPPHQQDHLHEPAHLPPTDRQPEPYLPPNKDLQPPCDCRDYLPPLKELDNVVSYIAAEEQRSALHKEPVDVSEPQEPVDVPEDSEPHAPVEISVPEDAVVVPEYSPEVDQTTVVPVGEITEAALVGEVRSLEHEAEPVPQDGYFYPKPVKSFHLPNAEKLDNTVDSTINRHVRSPRKSRLQTNPEDGPVRISTLPFQVTKVQDSNDGGKVRRSQGDKSRR